MKSSREVHLIALSEMFSLEELLCSALFGACVGGLVTILYWKLSTSKERLAERGGRRASGCNNPSEKQPVENDERRAKSPQEHSRSFNLK
ncbi:hypothetical protein AWC38_SpisGene20671 [Stylophora pistillata]|uniref:Uncharacterized protein n=1 Tax=Stylophora pistillata TaxID=50429 RepID=A0A2B4RBU7_STYPI|nr:hypothetical protein AWC38_SpisGene20671 [Stylophora pistillata]